MANSRQVGLCYKLKNDKCFEMTNKLLVIVCLCCSVGLQGVSSESDVTKDCASRWPRCITNSEYVECHDELGITDITEFYHCVEDNVVNITIIGSRIKELPPNTMGSCHHDPSLQLQMLKKLEFSNDTIEVIHGKSFHCMGELETLILAHNEWRVDKGPDQTGYFTSLPNLKHLDLTNAFEEVSDGSYHMAKLDAVFNETDMSQLLTLKLAHNEFFSFSISAANSLCNLVSLQTLDLSHNKLEYPSLPTMPNCLEALRSLNLSYNLMPATPKEFMSKLETLKDLQEVKLDNNPYNCDCGLTETWHWLNSTKKPVNKGEMKCATGFHSSYIGRPILSLKPSDLQCVTLSEPSHTAVKAMIGVAFIVIFVTAVVFLVIYRRLVKRWKKRVPTFRFRSHQDCFTVHDQVAVI